MKVIVSTAMSMDGYIDDCSQQRLILSSPEDWEQVRGLRAQCDAILVGAGTVRKDNPSLVLRDDKMRQERILRGQDPDPVKVTVTSSGQLSVTSDFLVEGYGKKIIFATNTVDLPRLRGLEEFAEIVELERVNAAEIVSNLSRRGYETLMVEGGSSILAMFLEEDMVDVMRLAIAPFFVGDSAAPRFVPDGRYPWNSKQRLTLTKTEQLGDMAVLWYERERNL